MQLRISSISKEKLSTDQIFSLVQTLMFWLALGQIDYQEIGSQQKNISVIEL